jgi:predicted dehydrogenase
MQLRAVIIGPGSRARYYYAPLLKKLKEEVELVAVWGRNAESARKFGDDFHIPWYTDMDRMVKEIQPDFAIVSVGWNASNPSNGPVGFAAVEHGLNVLLETPIAIRLDEADAIIESARKQKLKVEIAEQFYRRPHIQIILKCIEQGVFGKVYTSFNDFGGHSYHGISIMRSFLGFDAKPVRVHGVVRDFDIGPSLSLPGYSADKGVYGKKKENQEHGIIEFEDGKIGIYHWTDVAYNEPLRWWRGARFLAEKGMGFANFNTNDYSYSANLTLVEKDGAAPRPVTILRRLERVDGGCLQYLEARTGDDNYPVVRWDNPFASKENGQGQMWEDDEIAVAGCIMSLVNAIKNNTEPGYGPYQGRLDQELTLAIRESSKIGKPVELPMKIMYA